jgi:hypothetical protein
MITARDVIAPLFASQSFAVKLTFAVYHDAQPTPDMIAYARMRADLEIARGQACKSADVQVRSGEAPEEEPLRRLHED